MDNRDQNDKTIAQNPQLGGYFPREVIYGPCNEFGMVLRTKSTESMLTLNTPVRVYGQVFVY